MAVEREGEELAFLVEKAVCGSRNVKVIEFKASSKVDRDDWVQKLHPQSSVRKSSGGKPKPKPSGAVLHMVLNPSPQEDAEKATVPHKEGSKLVPFYVSAAKLEASMGAKRAKRTVKWEENDVVTVTNKRVLAYLPQLRVGGVVRGMTEDNKKVRLSVNGTVYRVDPAWLSATPSPDSAVVVL